MNFDDFAQQIQDMRLRVAQMQRLKSGSLRQACDTKQQLEMMTAAFEELSTSLEELQVASLELHLSYGAELSAVKIATERKQALKALQQAKEQMEAVLDAVPGFVSWISSDGRYIGVNRHLANTFNLSPDAFVGQELGFLQSSFGFAEFMRNFVASPEVAASQVIDAQVSGITRSYLIAAQKYQQGLAAVSVGIDITERKQAEEALIKLNKDLESRVGKRTAELEQKHQQLLVEIAHRRRFESALRRREQEFRALVENAPDIILRFDRDLRYVYVNPAIESATGIPPNEFIGKTSRELSLPEAYISLWEQVIGRIFETGQDSEIQFSLITPKGLKYYQARLVAEWAEENGRFPVSVLGIWRDITENKQVEEALRNSEQAARAQVEELEKLNRLKDEFLSTVSHELRTPLTNLKMAIKMLQVATKPEQRDRYMQILHDECTREISLVNDLLDLQRLEAGVEAVILEPLQLQSWLPPLVEPFKERAQSRQQTLKLEIPPNLPSIVSHPASLERILAELLNNACKYSPPGGAITVTALCNGPIDVNTRRNVELVVSNSGTEIPASELSRIFEKFYRAPSSDPWKQGGTGLGLALVQKLVDLLGGKVWVVSQAGQTTFTVELPVQ